MISLVKMENRAGKRISRKSISPKSAAKYASRPRVPVKRLRLPQIKDKLPAWMIIKKNKKAEKHFHFDQLIRAMRLWLLPQWKIMLGAVLANAIVGASTGSLPVFIQYSIDILFDPSSSVPLIFISLAVFLLLATRAGFTYIGNFLRNYVVQRMNNQVQHHLFQNLIHADYESISSIHTGRTMSVLMNEAKQVQAAIGSTLVNFSRHSIMLIGIFVSMLIINWRLTIFVLAMMPAVFFSMRFFSQRTKTSFRGVLNKMGDWSSHILEVARGLRIIKAYGTEMREINRASEKMTQVLRNNMRMQRSHMASGPVAELLVGIGMAAIFFYVGYEGRAGNFSQGELVGFIAAMLLIYQPLKAIASVQAQIQQGLLAVERVLHRLDKKPKITSSAKAPDLEIKDNSSEPRIYFHNVKFKYPKSRIPALKKVSLSVEPGKMAALVGRSGGGKSTMLNLLQRFYDADAGQIKIDGQNIREITVPSLRRSMALVLQDVFLFDDTIAANIAYAKDNATLEDIIKAAKIANAHDFIMAMPQKYETRIGENGGSISGGQRQRLAFARAALRDAPILLLDEPTSALDSESEHAIQEAMQKLLKNKTVLVIAHRLSTIMHADKIYVLHEGEIIEQGTHKSLLKEDGAYSRLYKTQFPEDQIKNDKNLQKRF